MRNASVGYHLSMLLSTFIYYLVNPLPSLILFSVFTVPSFTLSNLTFLFRLLTLIFCCLYSIMHSHTLFFLTVSLFRLFSFPNSHHVFSYKISKLNLRQRCTFLPKNGQQNCFFHSALISPGQSWLLPPEQLSASYLYISKDECVCVFAETGHCQWLWLTSLLKGKKSIQSSCINSRGRGCWN